MKIDGALGGWFVSLTYDSTTFYTTRHTTFHITFHATYYTSFHTTFYILPLRKLAGDCENGCLTRGTFVVFSSVSLRTRFVGGPIVYPLRDVLN